MALPDSLTPSSRLFPYRVEHETFTDKDSEAFKQLVRVVVRDFLPFVKRMFGNLYSEGKVEELALCTPYCLRHRTVGTGTGRAGKAGGVDLSMELDIKEMSEVLRAVASDVIEELEASQRLQAEEEYSIALPPSPLESGGSGCAVVVPSNSDGESTNLDQGNVEVLSASGGRGGTGSLDTVSSEELIREESKGGEETAQEPTTRTLDS